MAKKELSDGNPDGTSLGQSSTDKVGFFGATPAVRPAHTADATDAATAITAVNAVLANLRTLGLKASS